MSVGFKNGTDGSIDIAVDAIKAAGSGHTFLSVTKQGLSAIVETDGNPSTHVILRGSSKGPNYKEEYVLGAGEKLKKAGLGARIMVRRMYYAGRPRDQRCPGWIPAASPATRSNTMNETNGWLTRRSTARTAIRPSNIKNRSKSALISYVSPFFSATTTSVVSTEPPESCLT